MTETFKIRLAARCEAAGRPENEDNFQVAENLSVSNTGFTTDKIFPIGPKGTLLLVCDGMGGMNAGEVASAVGVETIKNMFAPQLLADEIIANDDSVCTYMKRAIIKADSRIKEEASKDDAKKGMGSTAVMAWLLGQKVYVAWCGDSRCYRYNSATGLEQLSHDHSYVQDLVDTGQLSADLAFDHPNKNIITRSLGDPRGAAKPDAKVYDLHKGDIILLCSDGLSDSLRDSEIAKSVSRSTISMEACRDALWSDSKQAGWHDNVTIVLAQIIDEKNGQINAQSQSQKNDPVVQITPQSQSIKTDSHMVPKSKVNLKIIITILIAVFLVGGGAVFVISKINNQPLSELNQQSKVSIEQKKQEIKELISPQKTDIAEEMESRLQSIIRDEKSPEIKTYINDRLQEKRNTIKGSEDIFSTQQEYQERLDKINEIIKNIDDL